MENRKILLLSGGGHCKSVLDCLLSLNRYSDIGIIVRDNTDIKSVEGVRAVGTDGDLPALRASGWTDAFVTLGSIGNPSRRRELYGGIRALDFFIPSIIDPTAVIGRGVTIGAGSFVGKRAVVNAGTQIGTGAIINTGAIIEHDCYIGDFAHISPGAVLCGEVRVGQNTHIGAGSTIRQQINIGKDSLIGLGSVVVGNIPDGCEAFGNPCRVVKYI